MAQRAFRLIAAFAICLAASSAVAGPDLKIEREKFNFGYAPQNTTVVTGFWMKSVGDDTVKISEIKTGCSCVMAPLPSKVIPPGDSMFLRLTWDLKNKVFSTGKYPYIYTNVREQPFRVYMDAVAMRFPDSNKIAFCRPHTLELAKVGGKLMDSLSFDIVNKFEHDLMMEVTSPPVEECELHLPEYLPAFGTAKGYIKIKDGYTDEEFKTSYTIMLSDPKGTIFTVPVRYRLIGTRSK